MKVWACHDLHCWGCFTDVLTLMRSKEHVFKNKNQVTISKNFKNSSHLHGEKFPIPSHIGVHEGRVELESQFHIFVAERNIIQDEQSH